MDVEMRWLLAHASASPKLQYRVWEGWPKPWSEWRDVPMAMAEQPAPPAPAVTQEELIAAIPLPKGWTREPDGRVRPPPGFVAVAQAKPADEN